tara:strand:- start:1768 stop:3276 length:1509 start_codon:yes stop_codon:yes gene_type:complete
MAKVTKGIISPIYVTESGDSYVALDGKAFLVNENEITEAEITSAPGEFRSLVLANNNFKITNEGVIWYHGTTKLIYDALSEKFFINNSEVLSESFSNHLLATGLVNYSLKSKIQLFEYAAKNHSSYVTLDFAQKIEEGDIKCYIMKLNEDFYIYRMNEANRIYRFSKLNANEAFDYVLEQTGHEITEMTAELLEGERIKAAEKLAKVNLLEEMIAFLKDQRGIIAEADKSIAEIKEADTLINSEIKRLEEEIETIKNGEDLTEACDACGEDPCECSSESNEVEETETEITESGEEAGIPGEDIESDLEEVDNSEDRETKGEEGTDEAPSDEGEEGAKVVVEDRAKEIEDELMKKAYGEEVEESDEVTNEEVEETNEDRAKEIEDELNAEGEPEKAEENQEEIEGNNESVETTNEEVEETTEEVETTNEEVEETNEDIVDRQDGYVPGILKYAVGDFAEGTEVQVDAEAYASSAKDESVTVFIGESPIKVTKREILLADGETV